MKTSKLNKTRILPFMAILFSMILVPELNVHGQDIKGKKGQPDVKIDVRREYDENGNISTYDSSYSFSWSYDGSMDMDSIFESLRNNFGISPFAEDDFFGMPFENHHQFRMLPYHDKIDPEADDDSLYGYINPKDSVYSFDEPFNFFSSPFYRNPLNDSLYNRFFNDPFFGQDPWQWPDFDFFRFSPSDSAYNFFQPFDMRSMLENHQRMMEEMHQFFELNRP